MQIFVDPVTRYAKMRAHTATHLLHAQLATIFPQTKQAGSLVDEDYLRFDFYADNALTDQQIQDIEIHINNQIAQALPVDIQEMSYDAAIAAGAKAFFEDKYGDTVRVVMIGSNQQPEASSQKPLSIELCGGTHVGNTAHIGAFAIVSQESVAAGIKRITAVIGPKVADELRIKNGELRDIAQVLGVQEKQISDKIAKIQESELDMRKNLESTETELIKVRLKDIQTTNIDGFIGISLTNTGFLGSRFSQVLQYVKGNNDLGEELIVTHESGQYAIKSNAGAAKSFAQSHGLKGGGSDTFFQGKDPKIVEIIQ